MDVLIGGMCITIASPVYRNGQLAGVLGADFTLDYITNVVNSIPYSKGEYGFLVPASPAEPCKEREEVRAEWRLTPTGTEHRGSKSKERGARGENLRGIGGISRLRRLPLSPCGSPLDFAPRGGEPPQALI